MKIKFREIFFQLGFVLTNFNINLKVTSIVFASDSFCGESLLFCKKYFQKRIPCKKFLVFYKKIQNIQQKITTICLQYERVLNIFHFHNLNIPKFS
jgi:hypothetical protein